MLARWARPVDRALACPARRRRETLVEALDGMDYYLDVAMQRTARGGIALMGLVKTIGVVAAFAAAALLSPVGATELKVGLSAPPSAMDPHFHNLTPNSSLLGHIFDRLVHQDPNQALIHQPLHLRSGEIPQPAIGGQSTFEKSVQSNSGFSPRHPVMPIGQPVPPGWDFLPECFDSLPRDRAPTTPRRS